MLSRLGKKIMVFDGGFGTELQKYDIPLGCIPEELNITNSEIIRSIHESYVLANADFISTNTFGANRFKLENSKYSLKEILLAAISNARSVSKDRFVMLDIGPLGQLLSPLGNLSFDEAYDAYKEIIEISKDYVDGFITETFTDLYELKTAILAIKENSDKPVFASLSFDETRRTLTGSTPKIVVNFLEGLNVDALGVNCSLGPIEMKSIIKEIMQYTHTPVIAQPNRGLPKMKDGKAYYDLSCSDYTSAIKEFVDLGVSVIGGCCGTTPDFIESISKYKNLDVKKVNNEYQTLVSSSNQIIDLNDVNVCGERINPTGKKKMKEAILNNDFNYLINEGIKQVNSSANLLDLNVGLPKIDEPTFMKEAIIKLQEVINLPFQIDSSNYLAIEQGARYYNGIPLINSVNGDYEVMDKIFPIAKKYGAVVLGLTMDHKGVPKTAIERLEIAKRIVFYAEKYGIKKHKIIIDTLTLTASAEQSLVGETLKALKLVKDELNVRTALGVSNVSFGLPERTIINRTFLAMALNNGLTMPIINPCDDDMMNTVLAFNLLNNHDLNCKNYLAKVKQTDLSISPQINSISLFDAIKLGLKSEASNATKKLLETKNVMDVINDDIIKALNFVGDMYSKGKAFLPELIMSAEATKEAFNYINDKFPKTDNKKGPIILATVKGDVHDIGKNIVKVVTESFGYKVIDLGKDVEIDDIINAYKKYNPKAIGLSALMTTTVVSMESTIKELKKIPSICPIFVGGAVLTGSIAKEINADYYTHDALEFVNLLGSVIDGKN